MTWNASGNQKGRVGSLEPDIFFYFALLYVNSDKFTFSFKWYENLKCQI